MVAAALLYRRAGEADWREIPDGGARQRRVDGRVHRRGARTLRVHGRRLDRPVRKLAPRAVEEVRGRAGRHERAPRRRAAPGRDAAGGRRDHRRPWSASARASARGTRCSPARPAPIRRAARRSRRRPRGSRTSPPWASTSSTCRRFTRSAAPSARGPTTRSRPGPTIRAARGPSAAAEGGHDAVEPGLGTIEDFDRFVEAARRHGLEIALDLAYQASPDHPYVKEHPEWFRQRPDGTIKYAENPPKKYQDIYPINFESPTGRRSGRS
jgi:hypothetical protein